MKAFIVNDTTKIFQNGKRIQHFGCELVMQTFREQLDRVNIELVGTIGRDKNFRVPKNIDLVIVNGEGSVHNSRFPHMVNIASEYPSVFVNAVWENNPPYKTFQKFKYVSVRESMSFNQLPKHPNTHVVPDIIYASSLLRSFKKPSPTENIGKTDSVKHKQAGFTAHTSAIKYLNEISKYRGVCVGRFHALIVASFLEIPFSVWKSNTHKNIGLVTDMDVQHLYFETQEEALKNIPTTFDERVALYVEQTVPKIEKMFEGFHHL